MLHPVKRSTKFRNNALIWTSVAGPQSLLGSPYRNAVIRRKLFESEKKSRLGSTDFHLFSF